MKGRQGTCKSVDDQMVGRVQCLDDHIKDWLGMSVNEQRKGWLKKSMDDQMKGWLGKSIGDQMEGWLGKSVDDWMKGWHQWVTMHDDY